MPLPNPFTTAAALLVIGLVAGSAVTFVVAPRLSGSTSSASSQQSIVTLITTGTSTSTLTSTVTTQQVVYNTLTTSKTLDRTSTVYSSLWTTTTQTSTLSRTVAGAFASISCSPMSNIQNQQFPVKVVRLVFSDQLGNEIGAVQPDQEFLIEVVLQNTNPADGSHVTLGLSSYLDGSSLSVWGVWVQDGRSSIVLVNTGSGSVVNQGSHTLAIYVTPDETQSAPALQAVTCVFDAGTTITTTTSTSASSTKTTSTIAASSSATTSSASATSISSTSSASSATTTSSTQSTSSSSFVTLTSVQVYFIDSWFFTGTCGGSLLADCLASGNNPRINNFADKIACDAFISQFNNSGSHLYCSQPRTYVGVTPWTFTLIPSVVFPTGSNFAVSFTINSYDYLNPQFIAGVVVTNPSPPFTVDSKSFSVVIPTADSVTVTLNLTAPQTSWGGPLYIEVILAGTSDGVTGMTVG